MSDPKQTFEEALAEVLQAGRNIGGYDDYYYGGKEHIRAAEVELSEAVAVLRAAHQREAFRRGLLAAKAACENVYLGGKMHEKAAALECANAIRALLAEA